MFSTEASLAVADQAMASMQQMAALNQGERRPPDRWDGGFGRCFRKTRLTHPAIICKTSTRSGFDHGSQPFRHETCCIHRQPLPGIRKGIPENPDVAGVPTLCDAKRNTQRQPFCKFQGPLYRTAMIPASI